MLRPLPPERDVHPRSSEPSSSKEDVSPLSTEQTKSEVQDLQDPAKEASKKNILGEDTSVSDAQRLRNELTETMRLLDDANVVITLLDKANKDMKLSLDQKKKQVEDLEEANAALDSTRVSHYTELDDVRKKLLRVEREYDELLLEFADSGLSDPAHVESLLLAIKGPPAISPDVLVNVINVMRRFQVSAKDVQSMVGQLQNRIEVEQLQNRIEQLQQKLLDVEQHDAFMTRLVEELQETLRCSQAEKLANVYEQRVENLQNENDDLRKQILMNQIEVDQLKDELALLDSLANTEPESQRALNTQIETLFEDNRKLAENQALHNSTVGKSDLEKALVEVDVDVIM
jgi:chromosome segregation ATPase